MEELIIKILTSITSSDHDERPRFTKDELELLISSFDCYYLGIGFRALTQKYEPSKGPESWSLEESAAVRGCSDCLPVGYPFPLNIYAATIEGLEIEVFLKNIEPLLKREEDILLWKNACAISRQEKEILGWVVDEVKFIREENLELY